MIHAYRETFLSKAMINMGDMFDCMIHGFGLDGSVLTNMFTASSICRRLENGEPKYLIGMSGIELAMDILEEMTGVTPVYELEDGIAAGRSPDHWCGWALCYYQWLRNIPYKEIFGFISYEEVSSLYRTLHQADLSKFADVLDDRRTSSHKETNLKKIRSAYGCSQRELAEMSGVSLRSIQMYEQRGKDINKAQVQFLAGISKALGCRIEDLLERS